MGILVCMKANRNNLAINNVRSFKNGLFGLQQYSTMTHDENHNFGYLWAAHTVNNFNLVGMPKFLIDLLVMGGQGIFNLVKSLMPLNLRKQAENFLPAAFHFWAMPTVKKQLDEKIKLLVFGGNGYWKVMKKIYTLKGFCSSYLLL